MRDTETLRVREKGALHVALHAVQSTLIKHLMVPGRRIPEGVPLITS